MPLQHAFSSAHVSKINNRSLENFVEYVILALPHSILVVNVPLVVVTALVARIICDNKLFCCICSKESKAKQSPGGCILNSCSSPIRLSWPFYTSMDACAARICPQIFKHRSAVIIEIREPTFRIQTRFEIRKAYRVEIRGQRSESRESGLPAESRHCHPRGPPKKSRFSKDFDSLLEKIAGRPI